VAGMKNAGLLLCGRRTLPLCPGQAGLFPGGFGQRLVETAGVLATWTGISSSFGGASAAGLP